MPPIVNFNSPPEKPRVLLAPLDWGWGHTTRCIPLIRELLKLDCTVLIACNSWQKEIYIQEFPDLTYLNKSGYNVRYAKQGWLTLLKNFSRIPKILTYINKERRWLKPVLDEYRIHAVISDNRFGLSCKRIPSIFITHQLQVRSGMGKWIDRAAMRLNYHFINRFSACWIPDFPEQDAMAGKLSHPYQLPRIPVKYLGGLSRLESCQSSEEINLLLIILSGPEPQRSLLEKLILQQILQYSDQIILVRGMPANSMLPDVPENVTVYNHVPAAVMNTLLCRASMVISRCGYTSVMDLLKLGKKSILIPTPGQTEQEYLAGWLQQQQLAYTVSQQRFNLQKDIDAARLFSFRKISSSMEQFKEVLREFVEGLRGNIE